MSDLYAGLVMETSHGKKCKSSIGVIPRKACAGQGCSCQCNYSVLLNVHAQRKHGVAAPSGVGMVTS